MTAYRLLPTRGPHYAAGPLELSVPRALDAAIATCVRFGLPPERLATLTLPNGDLAIASVGPGGVTRLMAIAVTEIAAEDLDRAFEALFQTAYFSAAPFPQPSTGDPA